MNGWLILDKPVGMTSAHAVERVKRMLGARELKIGHAGTLDPLASGVLPLALGEATKLVPWAMDRDKAYAFTVRWGEERATGDAEGGVTHTSQKRPFAHEINALLPGFTGLIQQRPPVYSAVKIGGKRSYALARNGETPALPEREVRVDALSVVMPGEDGPMESTSFLITCGKGMYVRSLGQDLGRALGCYGYITALRRTKVGKFSESCAISLENIEKIVHTRPLNWLHPMHAVLDDIPAWHVEAEVARRLKHGQAVPFPPEIPRTGMIAVFLENALIAMARPDGAMLRGVRVFNMVAGFQSSVAGKGRRQVAGNGQKRQKNGGCDVE